MAIERRRFIGIAAGAFAATIIPGCASVAAMRVSPSGGVVRLPLADLPQLTRPGGSLKIQAEGWPTPLYVLALDDGEYLALSPICTHLGCTVDIAGSLLVCPCHGSTYDRAGQVLRGPAERALQRLPTAVVDDVLTIQSQGLG